VDNRLHCLHGQSCGSEEIFKTVRRARVVLAFPGAAGSVAGDVVCYTEVIDAFRDLKTEYALKHRECFIEGPMKMRRITASRHYRSLQFGD
jgi:hypothetical protein